MKKMNNKGYMLVEIILASVIAMVVAYFVIDLTIKLKNKNDDLLVRTVVYTDQAIIYNTIMDDIYNSGNDISCDYINNKISIDKENNIFKYGDFINVVSEYASIGDYTCEGEGSSIRVNIPMKVKQLPDDNFNVNIGEVLEYMPKVDLECLLKVNGTMLEASSDVDNLSYYGWDSSYSGDNSTSKIINSVGMYTYYVKDQFGNTGSCGVDVVATNVISEPLYCTANCGGLSEGVCKSHYSDGCNWTAGTTGYCTGTYQYQCNTYTGYSCASGYTKINDSYCYILK